MSEARRWYATTPIYYASGEPHIGHAYTTFLGDYLARYHRQSGDEVFFLTGTDEHGQKILEEASRRGLQPIELCNEMAERFRVAWADLDISFDRFIRTTEAEHVAVVQAFMQRMYDEGHVYEDVYRGWYCVHEERYWTEKDLGPNNTCPDCSREVREIEEKNYFFRMSAFQDRLLAHIQDNPGWIVPEVRRNEVLGFLQQPLEDLSITRPRARIPWGVPVPWDEEHVTYVWVDALINYVTASGAIDAQAPADERGFGTNLASWWPVDVHLIGKDILTTHTVYWTTILMAVGLPLPKRFLAHGWWVVGDAKMSKSLGNVVDPLELRSEFGTDGVRWYLLREMPTGSDASYTPERFLARYEELANVLGNLASRVLSMMSKYRDGKIPAASSEALQEEMSRAREESDAAIHGLRVHEALAVAMDLARTANGYVEDRAPWAQAKDPQGGAELDVTLATLARCLTMLTALFEPVLPGEMKELARRLGLGQVPTLDAARTIELAGREVQTGPPLFPKRERERA